MKTYLLFEIANAHGGSPDYIYKLIDRLPSGKNMGIKFQVFKYDEIALKDYQWYPAYEKLFISGSRWKKIIIYAKRAGLDVWLDIFDSYSLKVLKENFARVRGVKLQSSVLENLKVLNGLAEIISGRKIKIIINVAGRTMKNINNIYDNFRRDYLGNEIIIQTGFQGYPTKKEDLLLWKIAKLKEHFPKLAVSFADHAAGDNPLALEVPPGAILAGAEYIEKHVCLDRKNAKYDYQSAIEPSECERLIGLINDTEKMLGQKFIAKNEQKYLSSTIEKPVAAENFFAQDVVRFKKLDFKRTAQDGISIQELKKTPNQHFIMNKDVARGQTLKKNDLRKARIGVIIACRMKSTRLKNKAVLPIGQYNSIERCIMNCKKIKSADEIILATSALKEDQILKQYALKHKIKFFAGDPEDVMQRFLGAAKKYKIDIIIRVTGDCPIVSYEMAEHLLLKHFQIGADYSGPKEFAVGQNSEVYNVHALNKIIEYLGDARYSEYMTWYMFSNKDIFDVQLVDLPKDWVRPYRLTLDEQSDLDMFNELFRKLGSREASLKNIFKVLDSNPYISRINHFTRLKYKADKKLIKMLNKKTRIRLPKK
ncbi:MAG: N-acetylneuraminate synthase family protein [bacterium]|nr:N-acetylneuraminate synthase family protein [bacterium]